MFRAPWQVICHCLDWIRINTVQRVAYDFDINTRVNSRLRTNLCKYSKMSWANACDGQYSMALSCLGRCFALHYCYLYFAIVSVARTRMRQQCAGFNETKRTEKDVRISVSPITKHFWHRLTGNMAKEITALDAISWTIISIGWCCGSSDSALYLTITDILAAFKSRIRKRTRGPLQSYTQRTEQLASGRYEWKHEPCTKCETL